MKRRDQYLKIVEWSEEDQCYIGRVPGLALGGVHGKNEAKVFEKLGSLVDEWLKIYPEYSSHRNLIIKEFNSLSFNQSFLESQLGQKLIPKTRHLMKNTRELYAMNQFCLDRGL